LNGVDPDRAIKALERNLSQVVEGETLSHAQLGNRIRNQTLLRLSIGAKPRGELNRRSKQIQVILDRLSRSGADPDLDWHVAAHLLVLSQATLDLTRAANRRDSRYEARHDAVSGVLDLAAA
jgi:hypothetical protein